MKHSHPDLLHLQNYLGLIVLKKKKKCLNQVISAINYRHLQAQVAYQYTDYQGYILSEE